MFKLAGRTAIVTGASRGIGPYIAGALAKEKVNLVLAARSITELESVKQRLDSNETGVIAVSTDVTKRVDLEALVAKSIKNFNEIDVLVNNSGMEMTMAYQFLGVEDIEKIIQVNLTAPMVLTRMILPRMLDRHCGHIVNISSLAGKTPPPYSEPYAATKAGLIAFTKSLRAECSGSGVSASVICPGLVDEAGMFQQIKVKTGITAPRLFGTSTPQAVGRAVIHAIKTDAPEIIVNPGPARLLMGICELSPLFAEWVLKHSGINSLFKKVADMRKNGEHAK